MRSDLTFFLVVVIIGFSGVYYTNLNKEVHTASSTLAKSRKQVIANESLRTSNDSEVPVSLEAVRANMHSLSELNMRGDMPSAKLEDLTTDDLPTDFNYSNSVDIKSEDSLNAQSEKRQLDWEASFTSWYLTLLRNKSDTTNFLSMGSPERCYIDIAVEKSKHILIKLTANSYVEKNNSSVTLTGLNNSFEFDGITNTEKLFQRTHQLLHLCE